jgi:hypothetical protein
MAFLYANEKIEKRKDGGNWLPACVPSLFTSPLTFSPSGITSRQIAYTLIIFNFELSNQQHMYNLFI